MFDTLVEQMKETEGVSEQLKEENQVEWICRMRNIEARAREIVTTELINNNTVIKILTFLEQKSIIRLNY